MTGYPHCCRGAAGPQPTHANRTLLCGADANKIGAVRADLHIAQRPDTRSGRCNPSMFGSPSNSRAPPHNTSRVTGALAETNTAERPTRSPIVGAATTHPPTARSWFLQERRNSAPLPQPATGPRMPERPAWECSVPIWLQPRNPCIRSAPGSHIPSYASHRSAGRHFRLEVMDNAQLSRVIVIRQEIESAAEPVGSMAGHSARRFFILTPHISKAQR